MQPQAYNRATDFTDRTGDDTDNSAINLELDAAALSINEIRDNLKLIQRDDGALANGIVTADTLDQTAFDAVQASVNAATIQAQNAATSATIAATTANNSKDAAVLAKNAAEAAQSASLLNANSAAADATEVNAIASRPEIAALGNDLSGLPYSVDYGDLSPATNPAGATGIIATVFNNLDDINAVGGDIAAINIVADNLPAINSADSNATIAANAATSAAASATTASTKAAESSAAASSANTKAAESNTSAASASSSASTATTKASEASASAASALSSKNAAETAKTAAQTAQTASELAALNASGSADSANVSKNLAQDWATKTTGAVSGGEYSAKKHAQDAASSASSASTSAGTATTKAAEALSSANTAAAAQIAAESARDATLAAYDNFDDRYLGVKTADPTLDNDGNPLLAGSLYFNSTLGIMKIYSGTVWAAAYVSSAGVLMIANNLSDLANIVTARANLGLQALAIKNSVGTSEIDNSSITAAKLSATLDLGVLP